MNDETTKCNPATAKKNNLIIEHVNAQSLTSNFDDLTHMVTHRDIDILCINETWLFSHTPDAHVQSRNGKLRQLAMIFVQMILNSI